MKLKYKTRNEVLTKKRSHCCYLLLCEEGPHLVASSVTVYSVRGGLLHHLEPQDASCRGDKVFTADCVQE